MTRLIFDEVDEMLTIRDVIRWTWSRFNQSELFYGHGSDNAWDEACHLVLGCLKLPWDMDPMLLDARLSKAEKGLLKTALEKRIDQRIPLPYILGEAWFMGLAFKVTPEVLIPRSPIAELLNESLSPWLQNAPLRILDLCCGSGCIGIAAAHVFEDAEVVLSDISEQALAIARENIARYGLEDRVSVCQSDVFASLEGHFDVILTNPPYVDQEDMDSLPEEYRHEPVLALASGDDGLDCTRSILEQARNYLAPEGLIVLEVGNSLEALLSNFPQLPFMLPDFEQGGHGVALLTEADLSALQ